MLVLFGFSVSCKSVLLFGGASDPILKPLINFEPLLFYLKINTDRSRTTASVPFAKSINLNLPQQL